MLTGYQRCRQVRSFNIANSGIYHRLKDQWSVYQHTYMEKIVQENRMT